MAKEERLNKSIYKIELWLIKTVPFLMAGCTFVNCILSYFGINFDFLSYFGGVSILTIILLYVSSVAFKFCKWQRMPIHYVTLNCILNTYDYYCGIPVGDRDLIIIYFVITFVFLMLTIHFKINCNDNKRPHCKTAA
jgi:hypothetical protein